jgi:hypothetical protein
VSARIGLALITLHKIGWAMSRVITSSAVPGPAADRTSVATEVLCAGEMVTAVINHGVG